MTDPIVEHRGGATWDIGAFVASFVLGVFLYGLLHFGLNAHQAVVTFAILSCMFAYAASAAFMPRLRVRLDQAGDNVYYLGLLFTLTSMAVALYEFGSNSGSDSQGARRGAQAIIENFGIALASTIVGIFLRVVLNQMRVDPSDVEGMTRIELSEATKRVRGSLDNMTLDLGQFHDEVRQRSSDVIVGLVDKSRESISTLSDGMSRTMGEMISTTAAAHRQALDESRKATGLIVDLAQAAGQAVDRLRSIEPPPLTLARRLDKIGSTLERAAAQTERISVSLSSTAEAGKTLSAETAQSAAILATAARGVASSSEDSVQRIKVVVEEVAKGMETTSRTLAEERALLVELESLTRRIAADSRDASGAANEVLDRLAQIVRGLAEAFPK